MAVEKKISRSAKRKQRASAYWREIAQQSEKQSKYYAALLEKHGVVIVFGDDAPSHPEIYYSAISEERGAIIIK